APRHRRRPADGPGHHHAGGLQRAGPLAGRGRRLGPAAGVNRLMNIGPAFPVPRWPLTPFRPQEYTSAESVCRTVRLLHRPWGGGGPAPRGDATTPLGESE